MFSTVRKIVTAAAALAALALGGSVIANAATSGSTTTSPGSAAQPPYGGAANGAPPNGGGPRGGHPAGRHVGANGQREQALSAADAAKVKAAALAKLPGATVERVETDVDFGSPYEAHVRKADGTEVSVLVNSSFQVTAVKAMQHP
jgi:hypothetical protein